MKTEVNLAWTALDASHTLHGSSSPSTLYIGVSSFSTYSNKIQLSYTNYPFIPIQHQEVEGGGKDLRCVYAAVKEDDSLRYQLFVIHKHRKLHLHGIW